MKHIFREGDPTHPGLLLLHGTGGNENDLLPIAENLDHLAPFLSVRGQILEHGMPRFFKRLAEGIFDEKDLIFRTGELKDFLAEAGDKYNFNAKNLVAVGYSNGANIAASLMFHHQDVLKAAILFHPMVPRRGIDLPDLKDVRVFIASGRRDPICPPQETDELQELLEGAGAKVEVFWSDGGHQLTMEELQAAKGWYNRTFSMEE